MIFAMLVIKTENIKEPFYFIWKNAQANILGHRAVMSLCEGGSAGRWRERESKGQMTTESYQGDDIDLPNSLKGPGFPWEFSFNTVLR